METITLAQFCRQHGGMQDAGALPDGVARVDAMRQREMALKNYLPGWMIRRLDAGMARSNTVHPDTGRALYALCRAFRVRNVFETGTYWGYSTAYLAAALSDQSEQSGQSDRQGPEKGNGGNRENGTKGKDADAGRVWTFDIYPRAGSHIPRGLRPRVELVRGLPATQSMPAVLQSVTPDLFFQDSRHDYEGVTEELQMVAPHLRAGAIVLLHDFVEPAVQQAAHDALQGYALYRLEGQDPQQLGVAIKTER